MNPNEVKRALVIGAGTMGHSIAQVFAQIGIEVNLVDLNENVLKRAENLVKSNLETLADFGRVARKQIPSILKHIRYSTELKSATDSVDFAIEAVVEVPDVKREIFRRLDELCPSGTVLASNTSSLNVFEIAKIRRLDRLVVAHWFAPPHIIPLVEVVPGPETSPETLNFTAKLMERLGKRPVVMKSFVPSFIVNRIQNAIFATVMVILQQGWATVEDIDVAVKTSLGIRLPIVGVAQTLDFTGLNLIHDLIKAGGMPVPAIIEEKVKKGHLGVSTSKGMYDYGGRTEEEILRKRDELYLKLLDHLEKIKAFDRV